MKNFFLSLLKKKKLLLVFVFIFLLSLFLSYTSPNAEAWSEPSAVCEDRAGEWDWRTEAESIIENLDFSSETDYMVTVINNGTIDWLGGNSSEDFIFFYSSPYSPATSTDAYAWADGDGSRIDVTAGDEFYFLLVDTSGNTITDKTSMMGISSGGLVRYNNNSTNICFNGSNIDYQQSWFDYFHEEAPTLEPTYTPTNYFNTTPQLYVQTQGYNVKFLSVIEHYAEIDENHIEWSFDEGTTWATICEDTTIQIVSYVDSCGVKIETGIEHELDPDTTISTQEFFKSYPENATKIQSVDVTFIDENDNEIALSQSFTLGTTKSYYSSTTYIPPQVNSEEETCSSFDTICIMSKAIMDFLGIGATLDESGNTIMEFEGSDFGLLAVLQAPLATIQTITTSSCIEVNLPLPYMTDKSLYLPCMSEIYEDMLGNTFYLFYQAMAMGIICTLILVDLWNTIAHTMDPKGRLKDNIDIGVL